MTSHRGTAAIRIAELPAGTLGGMVGVTFAPGKQQTDGLTGRHDRDLDADLDVVAAWGAAAVVTLNGGRRARALRIPEIGAEVRARFMEWHHLPVRDVDVPDAAFEADWPQQLGPSAFAGGRWQSRPIHCRAAWAGPAWSPLGSSSRWVPLQSRPSPPSAVPATPGPSRPALRRIGSGRATRSRLSVPRRASARVRAVGAMLGLAVGDAVGTTIEFSAKPAGRSCPIWSVAARSLEAGTVDRRHRHGRRPGRQPAHPPRPRL